MSKVMWNRNVDVILDFNEGKVFEEPEMPRQKELASQAGPVATVVKLKAIEVQKRPRILASISLIKGIC